jgi:hypothetical protein
MRRASRAAVLTPKRRRLWTPFDLPVRPSIWLNDQGAVTDAGSGACSQWNDISGNNYHFKQTTSANRPLIVSSGLNGRRTIRFDGTNDMLYTTAADTANLTTSVGALTEFLLYKKLATDAGVSRIVTFVPVSGVGAPSSRHTIACSGTVGGQANKTRGAARRERADAAVELTQGTSLGTAWQSVMFSVVYADRDGFLDIDGANDQQNLTFTTAGSTTDAISTTSAFSIGGNSGVSGDNPSTSNPADVEIAERLLIVGNVSQADKDRVFGYMHHRWGLAANLSSSHPYRYAPPYA